MSERIPPLLVVGLDPSPTYLGWAIKSHRGPVRCGRYRLAEYGGDGRAMLRAVQEVEGIARQLGGIVETVVVEAAFVGPNARSAIMVAESMGQAVLAAEISWPRAEMLRMSPPTWRKQSGISGRASKADVMVAAKARGWFPESQDAADAAMMAEAA